VPGFNHTEVMDYLSFDIDASGLDVIKTFPFTDFKFRVVTLEHDKYRFGQSVQDEMHAIMESQGYVCIVKNLMDGPHNPIIFPSKNEDSLSKLILGL
jgi:hypothetical protein